jgi:hypothetical protein
MGEEALVDGLVDDAISLVQKLDAQGDKPQAAAWHYFPDAGEWRLLIAGDSLDALLPKQEHLAYQRVGKALTQASVASLSIGAIKLVLTTHPLLAATRALVTTGPDALGKMHIKDCTVNGIFIKEMVALRSAPPTTKP